MLEIGSNPDLVEEPFGAEHCHQLRSQELEGDSPIVPHVLGEEHQRHPTLAELTLDTVAFGQRRREALCEIHHSARALSWFAMYSDVRQERAMIVQVGFLSSCDVKGAPSATNRFLTSWVWQFEFTTEVLGSAPMRAPPSSLMITRLAARPGAVALLGISHL